jgi:inhibitor of cysteine peptidase
MNVMKKLMLPLFLALLAVTAPAAESKPTELEAIAGKKFTITLKSNPTTGYSWALAPLPEGAAVKFVEQKYERPNTGMMGAGGQEIWTFEAVKPGKAEITLKYARSWEKDKPAAETRVFTVTVKAAPPKN